MPSESDTFGRPAGGFCPGRAADRRRRDREPGGPLTRPTFMPPFPALAGSLLVPLLATLLVACGEARPAGPSSGTADPVDGSWELVAGRTADGPMVLVEGAAVTLDLEGTEASGRSACNHYGATVDRDGGAIGIGQVGGTEMACEPAVMELEQRYLTALQAVDTVAVADGRLTLTAEGVRLEFERVAEVPTADLVGTAWVLDSLLRGDAASSTVGEPAELLLRGGGAVRGSTGCRSFVGTYTVRGGEVLLTALDASTGPARDCRGAVRDQDSQVLQVLGDGFRAAVDGQSLTLTSRGGLGLVYRAVAPDVRE